MGGSDPPTNFEDLLKKAVSAEAALKAKHSIQELVEGMDAASTADVTPPEDPNTAKIEALEKQIEAMKEGIKCWFCSQVGHTKKFCLKFKISDRKYLLRNSPIDLMSTELIPF